MSFFYVLRRIVPSSIFFFVSIWWTTYWILSTQVTPLIFRVSKWAISPQPQTPPPRLNRRRYFCINFTVIFQPIQRTSLFRLNIGDDPSTLLYLYRARIKITQLSIPTHVQLQRHRLKFIKNHLKKKLAPSSILREAKIAYYPRNMFEAGRFFFS